MIGIYIASKIQHAARWRALRESGVPVISTWIDEAGPGETQSLPDLWRRCINEAAEASALILYLEPGETAKGALVEVGAALAGGVPVLVVGEPPGTFTHHALVVRYDSLDAALEVVSTLLQMRATNWAASG